MFIGKLLLDGISLSRGLLCLGKLVGELGNPPLLVLQSRCLVREHLGSLVIGRGLLSRSGELSLGGSQIVL